MKFARGDVVLQSVPYAVVVDEEFFKEICSACMKPSSELLVCSKCRHLRYCSQQCQVSFPYCAVPSLQIVSPKSKLCVIVVVQMKFREPVFRDRGSPNQLDLSKRIYTEAMIWSS